MPEDNYWIISIKDEKSNISIASKEEVEAVKEAKDKKDWMIEPVKDYTRDEMIERAEEKGYEFDPWS